MGLTLVARYKVWNGQCPRHTMIKRRGETTCLLCVKEGRTDSLPSHCSGVRPNGVFVHTVWSIGA